MNNHMYTKEAPHNIETTASITMKCEIKRTFSNMYYFIDIIWRLKAFWQTIQLNQTLSSKLH